MKRVSQIFSYYFEYNISTFGVEAIIVNWPRVDVSVHSMLSILQLFTGSMDVQVLNEEAGYSVVVMSESGVETVIDILTGDNCTGDTCSYIFSSDSITTSYSVNVEVVGCTTETFMAENISSCKKVDMYSILNFCFLPSLFTR